MPRRPKEWPEQGRILPAVAGGADGKAGGGEGASRHNVLHIAHIAGAVAVDRLDGKQPLMKVGPLGGVSPWCAAAHTARASSG